MPKKNDLIVSLFLLIKTNQSTKLVIILKTVVLIWSNYIMNRHIIKTLCYYVYPINFLSMLYAVVGLTQVGASFFEVVNMHFRSYR